MRSLTSGSIKHPEGPQESWVRVCSNLAHFLFRPSLEGVRQHDDTKARVSTVGGEAMGEGFELLRDDDHRRLLEPLDGHGVVDTPRRARTSVAEADHAALDETRPLFDVGARLLPLGADAVAGPQHAHVGTVGA